MTRFLVALALLTALPLAAGHADPAAIGAGLQVASAEATPIAPTDDALFGRSDWSLADFTAR